MPHQEQEPDFIPDDDFVEDEPDFIPDDIPLQQDEGPSFWDRISSPLTDLPSRVGRNMANVMDPNTVEENYLSPDNPLSGIETFGRGVNKNIRQFLAGSTEGTGNLLSSMTSPIDLGAAVLSGGSSMAGRAGYKGLSSGLRALSGAMSAPVAAHGASSLYEGATEGDLSQMGQGLVELAGGTAGMSQLVPNTIPDLATPEIKPPTMRDRIAEIEALPDELPSQSITPINQNAPQPKTIYVKPSDTAIQDIKRASEMGYEHAGLDDKGRVKMIFTGKTKSVGPLETEILNKRGGRSTNKVPEETSITQEIVNFPRAVMASTDFSAPLRQGLPLIHKKAFWTSLDDMFRAWGSENAYHDIQKEILSRPLFKSRVGPDNKVLPSFAEDAGLKLSDLDSTLTNREEALQSKWAEMLPGVRRSNRAYTAFLNKLRADTFENLVNDSKIFSPGSETNTALSKELANFVNTASGRGSLGKLESSAKFLNATLFAPRLIASRLQMLNPHYYWAADPTVRKEALKSLLAVTGVGTTLGQLAKMAGAEVESTPTSADFGKIKVGDIRLDPFAGFQQYAVLAARMIKGEVESTTTGNTYKLGEKFGRPTRLDILGRFGEGKANPILSFITGLLRGKDFVGKPFDVPEEMASRLVPIYLQDLKEILTNNPNLVPFYHDEGLAPEGVQFENLPFAIPPAFGMGMQNYGSMK